MFYAFEPPAMASDVTTPAASISARGTDVHRYLAPPTFAYWSGSERTQSGELSIAAPRPFEARTLAPALDDHQSTTAFLQGTTTTNDGRPSGRGFALTSVHDLPGGAVASATFDVDARERTAVGGTAKATIPLPGKQAFVLVPSLGIKGGGDFAPLFLGGAELWTDRRKGVGGTARVEVTAWTHDRTRLLGEVAGLARLHRRVSIEERLALGAWIGPDVGGEAAFRWTSAALQDVGHAFALYERLTLTRGLAATTFPVVPTESAFSTDLAMAVRRAFGAYGVAVEAFEGTQVKTYRRWGAELTLYGIVL